MQCSYCGFPFNPQPNNAGSACPRCGSVVSAARPAQMPAGAGFAGPAAAYPVVPLAQPAAPMPGAPPSFSAPMQPNAPFGPGFPQGGYPPAAPKRNKLVWYLLACGVVLVSLLGGLLFIVLGHTGNGAANGPEMRATTAPTVIQPSPTAALPTATATQAVPSGFKVYSNQALFYSVAYPTNWQAKPYSKDTDEFDGPDNQEAAVATGVPKPGVTAADFDNQWCSGDYAAIGKTNPRSVTIAGQTWTEEECVDNSLYNNKVESVIYHGHLFALTFSSPKLSFDNNQRQFFSVMEQTFRFLI